LNEDIPEVPVPSVTSTQSVDPSTHTSALNSQKQTQAQQYQDSTPRTAPQEQPQTKTNSIQDYLKRQQNK
jgi:cell division protein FtsZ